MAQTEVKISALGERIAEVTLIKWLVNPGDFVEAEQPLAKTIHDLIHRARENKLIPAEIKGSTYHHKHRTV
ncbi:MAG: hypothetical protein JW973_08070 [Bacteroidales bacterium]|nr:hypothetical protein [Bacteroidales bacterium]